MNKLLLTLLLAISSQIAYSQSAFAPLNQDYYHLIDRYEIKQKNFSKSFFTTSKPYTRKAIGEFLDSLEFEGDMSKADKFNLMYLRNDNWDWVNNAENDSEKAILKHFYKKKSDLFHVQEDGFGLHVNPILAFSVGQDDNVENIPFVNTRGVEIRGNINKNVGFYSFISENQVRFPSYVVSSAGGPLANGTTLPTIQQNQNAIPGEGFWKIFKEDGYDFFNARGYITVSALKDKINFQFGHDRNFIGNGYRSLILSDFATNYLFIKMQTKVWKFNYTNITANLVPTALQDGTVFKNKYLAFHHLSFNVTDNLNIGLFESVTFGRNDSTQTQGFDFNYLNPVVFFRPIEQNRASFDNAILGLDWKWNLWGKVQFYGQYVLDELVFSEFKSRSGDWRNKQAGQIGVKYIDAFGIKNLDLQGEYNFVRPFTYTHNDRDSLANPDNQNYTNYQHFGQALAHPLGANFSEFIGILRYQPIPRLNLVGKLIYANIGEDFDSDGDGEIDNFGGNIFKDNDTRAGDREKGFEIGSGANAKLMFASFTASYQLRHNFFLEGKAIIRKFDSEIDARDLDTNFLSLGVRWNIPQRDNEF